MPRERRDPPSGDERSGAACRLAPWKAGFGGSRVARRRVRSASDRTVDAAAKLMVAADVRALYTETTCVGSRSEDRRSVVLGASRSPSRNPVQGGVVEHEGRRFGHPSFCVSGALPQNGEEAARFEVCACRQSGDARVAIGLVRAAAEAPGWRGRTVAAPSSARARSRARGTEQIAVEVRERDARPRVDGTRRRGRLEVAPIHLIGRRLGASRQDEKCRASKGKELATHCFLVARASLREQTASSGPRAWPPVASATSHRFPPDLPWTSPRLRNTR